MGLIGRPLEIPDLVSLLVSVLHPCVSFLYTSIAGEEFWNGGLMTASYLFTGGRVPYIVMNTER